MDIRISKPNDINQDYLNQIIDLILLGGQIKSDRTGIRTLIMMADLVAFKLFDEIVICTATLKNQYPEYRDRIFDLAMVQTPGRYLKELGYIVTHPDFENQGHCQDLLGMFFSRIKVYPIYATTRKPSMKHILYKLGFRTAGKEYNNDLSLLIYESVNGPTLHNHIICNSQENRLLEEIWL